MFVAVATSSTGGSSDSADDDGHSNPPTATLDLFEIKNKTACMSMGLCDEVVDAFPWCESELVKKTNWADTLHYMTSYIPQWYVDVWSRPGMPLPV